MQWKIWSLENIKSRGIPIPNLKFSSMMTDTGLSHRNRLGEAEVRALKMDHQLSTQTWQKRPSLHLQSVIPWVTGRGSISVLRKEPVRGISPGPKSGV